MHSQAATSRWRNGLIGVGAVACSPAWGAAYLGTDIGVNQGDFGTANTSTLYTANVYGGVVAARYDASLSVPVLHLRDEQGLSESGLGDVLARGGFGFLRSGGWTGDAALSVKLPTADEDKCLGTGELDLGAFVDLGWQWDVNKISAGLGFIAVGDAPGIDYDNVATWNLSLFTRVDRVGLQFALRGQTSMFADGDTVLDLYVGGFYAFGSAYAATFSGFVGLSDGAPDAGGSVGVVRWF